MAVFKTAAFNHSATTPDLDQLFNAPATSASLAVAFAATWLGDEPSQNITGPGQSG